VTEPLLTARDVAELVDVHVETVLRWVRQGLIPAVRLPGGAIRFRPEELEAWLAEHATAPPGREARATRTDDAGVTLSLPSRSRATPLRHVAATTDEED
jgi:excisionase family DNA binding protein